MIQDFELLMNEKYEFIKASENEIAAIKYKFNKHQ